MGGRTEARPRPSGQEAVDRLAAYLLSLDNVSFLTTRQQQHVTELWNDLEESEKQRVTYAPRYQLRHVAGRFRRIKTQVVVPGVESVRRAFIGPGTPAQRPQLSHVVDTICSQNSRVQTVYGKSKKDGVRLCVQYTMKSKRLHETVVTLTQLLAPPTQTAPPLTAPIDNAHLASTAPNDAPSSQDSL